MSPGVQKLIGQAIVQLIIGNMNKAAELSAKAHKMWFKEYHLHATIGEIIKNKSVRKEA